MKVKDLMNLEIDIDVVDNYSEELYIAFCPPCNLTEAGKKRFSKVLNLEIEKFNTKHSIAVVNVIGKTDAQTEKTLELAKDFFESFAGFCSSEDWEKYFC